MDSETVLFEMSETFNRFDVILTVHRR